MELVKGQVYIVKHSSGFIRARFEFVKHRAHFEFVKHYDGRSIRYSYRMNARTHYIFTNLVTGREIELKSIGKIRREVV